VTPDEQAEFDAAQAEVRALIKKLDPDDDAQRRQVAAEAKEVIARLPRNAQQALLVTEFLEAYHRFAPGETPALTNQLCACGCQWPVTEPWPEEYATDACMRNQS
jgi:hypothetical protein